MASSARIDELRKKFDENPRRYFAPLANEYRKAGDAEQAIFICQEYLPQQPGHMSGHIVYGQALYELNRHDEARTVFETALSLDPENLIALRHLGDIARQSGDTDTARVWYQRVLEADPRNEEIAQIMLSLLSSDAGPASESAPAGEFGEPRPSAPTPMTNSAVATGEASSAQQPATAQFTADAGARGGDPSGAEASHEQARIEATDEVRPLSPHAPSEADLLDLDDFDLGGIPLSELRAASPTPIYQPAQPFDESTASGIELPPIIASAEADTAGENLESSDALDRPATNESEDPAFATEEAEFEADPYAVASASFDNDVGNDDDSLMSRTADSAAESLTESTSEDAASPDESIDGAYGSTFDSASGAEGDEPSVFVAGFATFAVDDAAGDEGDVEDDASTESTESPPEPTIELATDLRLGLESDAPTETAPSAPSSMDGLETFEAGVFASEPAAIGFIETESFFETTDAPGIAMSDATLASEEPSVSDVAPASAFGDTDVAADAPPAEQEPAPVEAFVTETMAELYLEQGHLEPALDIYQRLVDQRPEDPDLFLRMQAVQDRIDAGFATPVGLPADIDVAPARSYGGPTIREFLSGLARKMPGYFGSGDDASYVHAGPIDAGVSDPYARDAYAGDDFSAYVGTPAPYDGIDEPFNTGEPLADRAIDRPLEKFGQSDEEREPEAPAADFRGDASARGSVGTSLDALFSGADAVASDTEAANTLAAAFASEGPETAALEGLPAHRAASELSLDHVFRGNTAPRPAGDSDGFSFDQFFADEVTDSAAETSSDTPPAAAQGADDIAQFNAWLNGLKKT